jgi:molybdenum cofactor cytidylyltransferase
LKPSVIDKTLAVLGRRLEPTGARIMQDRRVPHEAAALALELASQAGGDTELIIVFGASAIADRRDVIPLGIEMAGGRVEHFGMPVDPGNLLLVGSIAGKPVIGAPGCARSPKENGFDWILHRLLADVPVTRADITSLGVGGLLMEIVSRPQPREGGESEGEE